MKVERVYLEGELGVVNAARISFNKWKIDLDDTDRKLIQYLRKHKHKSPFFHPQRCFKVDRFNLNAFSKLQIAGLEWLPLPNPLAYVRCSEYLWEEIGESKFKIIEEAIYNEEWLLKQYDLYDAARLPYLQFRVKVPFFVRNQLDRHRVGLSINEVSRRYTSEEIEFYEFDKWRVQSQNNKQCSIEDECMNEVVWGVLSGDEPFQYTNSVGHAKAWYDKNIQNGMCREQARTILPQSTYTTFVWTGSVQDFARICSLRLKKNVQLECQEVAQMFYDLCVQEYPQTFDKLIALCEDSK
jgi:flavin-dependent thymidylate synthase